MTQTLYESSIKSLPLLGRGKVRDIYAVSNDRKTAKQHLLQRLRQQQPSGQRNWNRAELYKGE